jgi:riboflavin biosynthesis pyrimidine reductase
MLAEYAAPVRRLYPEPAGEKPLCGLYLEDGLRPAGTADKPFVYASFVASLDGRVSLPDPETHTRKPPGAITNPRDWRLFQELAAAADAVVTTGRYIRDLAAGGAQAALPVLDKPEFRDLHAWRREQGFAPQPAVAIVSGNLEFSLPEDLLELERAVYVLTGDAANSSRAKALTSQGARVVRAGDGQEVEGRLLLEALSAEGFGNVDMIAGGVLLNTLLADGAIDRLYLTQVCRALGGVRFDTFVKGSTLDPVAAFKLRSLCLDAGDDDGIEQLFSVFDCRK